MHHDMGGGDEGRHPEARAANATNGWTLRRRAPLRHPRHNQRRPATPGASKGNVIAVRSGWKECITLIDNRKPRNGRHWRSYSKMLICPVLIERAKLRAGKYC